MTYKTAEERAAYARMWRAKNPERAREIDAKRYPKRKRNPMKDWRVANPEKAKAQAERQLSAHSERMQNDPVYREQVRARLKRYNSKPEVRAKRRKQWRDWNAKSRAADPTFDRRRSYRALYGITIEQYDEMLAAQDGCCALCGVDKPGNSRQLFFHVDHCHNSDKVRALLCHSCNLGLGSLKDDPDLLRKAADYIERHRS